MNRHQLREKAVICLYQHLLIDKDIEEVIDDVLSSEEAKEDFFFRSITINVVNNKDFLIQKINENLSNWSFDRLGYIEQAILLVASCEVFTEELDKAVILNEAIELAKVYGEEDSYKLINGVLDRL